MARNLAPLFVVAMLVLAGCAGSFSGENDRNQTVKRSEPGTLSFYLSDRPNAIDEFAHLTVTVTKVGFHRTTDATTDDREGSWVAVDVPDAAVDLTTLTGKNATLLSRASLPGGSYDRVYIYVSEISATLDSSESVSVKLPSDGLRVNANFTVGANETVRFVFDLAVVQTGNQSRYLLKPVAGATGAGKAVKRVPPAVARRNASRTGNASRPTESPTPATATGRTDTPTPAANATERGNATRTANGTG